MANKFKVSAYLVTGDGSTFTKTIKAGLSANKASFLRDKLEDSNIASNFNPNELVSYLIEPA